MCGAVGCMAWQAVNVEKHPLPDNLHSFATSNLGVRLLSTTDDAHAAGVGFNTAALVADGTGAA